MASLTEDVEQELSATAQQVLGKLWSHQLFQSKWDTGAFIIFLVFLGVVALLLLAVCIHCCCCGCCQSRSSRSRKKHSVGFDNLALEP
ncbi:small integral membrane protein 22 [Balaenoptera acutorostrata]|uniref:Small integral membrane protein 22 n=1 Tax=Balaenoptera acutorostrata TaxID=9767 RepID=A0A384A2K6_BALAC|nr:small integral membrane protein 22 [Balaenoptera acutorostrata]